MNSKWKVEDPSKNMGWAQKARSSVHYDLGQIVKFSMLQSPCL